MSASVPVIDIRPLVSGIGDEVRVARAIGQACRESGFFYVTGHGVDEPLQRRLENLSREFFARDIDRKMAIRMDLGGRAWRGYFPVGGELTSGKPDQKEGIYFGAELPDGHAMVRRQVPLHGRNLFPEDMPELRTTVLAYMDAMTTLGHAIMTGIALSLALERSYFADRYTADPLVLFRIFNYPGIGDREPGIGDRGPGIGDRERGPGGADRISDPGSPIPDPRWGVGEHTDYGLLTILKQDDTGGLQVKSQSQWIAAPAIPGTFLCNIGDMLDRMTGGRYCSTPHRVQNVTSRDRLSFPFFFDPNFNAEVRPIDIPDTRRVAADWAERWDGASVHEVSGTYGEYVLSKVSKVFPQLKRDVL